MMVAAEEVGVVGVIVGAVDSEDEVETEEGAVVVVVRSHEITINKDVMNDISTGGPPGGQPNYMFSSGDWPCPRCVVCM